MYSNNVNINVSDNTFTNNTADANIVELTISHHGSGGGLILDCSDFDTCDITIDNNQFINNTASNDGGGMCWFDVAPKELLTRNVWTNNTAIYGSNY